MESPASPAKSLKPVDAKHVAEPATNGKPPAAAPSAGSGYGAARGAGQPAAGTGEVPLHKVPSHEFFHRKSQVDRLFVVSAF